MVLCGIPASGKTTLAKELKEKYNAKLHSYDDVKGANTDISSMADVYDRWIKEIKMDIYNGFDVVCDGTNLTEESRKKLLHYLEEFQCEKVLYVLYTPLDVCLKRNAKRANKLPEFIITQSRKMYEAPCRKEGWNKIIIIKS